MRILSMTATFGKLDGATLRFGGGLNVIDAPNEWGKSTWCAFLVAMLYGIDTRSRASRGQLPEKEKYAPWSGKPMEGSIRLIYKEKDITIQRRTRGRIPLGEFQAFETRTGLPVRELTAENCGMELLGVERSVFLRTGFLRLKDLTAPADETLRSRLSALVTTGDDSGDAELLGKKLRELKNRCRYNRSGLIPECTRQLETLEAQLRDRQALTGQMDRLEAQIAQWEQSLAKLQLHRDILAYRDSVEDQQKVLDAEQAEKTARRLVLELEEKCETYPPRQELLGRIHQAEGLLEEADHPAGAGRSPVPGVVAWLLAVLSAAGAFWLLGQKNWTLGGALLAAALCCGVLGRTLSGKYRRAALERRAEQAKLSNRREELEHALRKWRRQLSDLDDLDQARLDARKARAHLETLRSTARRAEDPDQEDPLDLSREDTGVQLTQTARDLNRARTLLAQCTGKLETMPDQEALLSGIQAARLRLSELEKTNLALEYAQKALDAASRELQRRFAPQITQRAEEFLRFLTDGKYDRISIGEDLTIQAAQAAEATLRGAAWRSDGTGDLMYLALRLAVWEVLSPEAPLVLDDALVRFDSGRLEKAMELLAQLGDTRQILLFSCQDRERRWMDQ